MCCGGYKYMCVCVYGVYRSMYVGCVCTCVYGMYRYMGVCMCVCVLELCVFLSPEPGLALQCRLGSKWVELLPGATWQES